MPRKPEWLQNVTGAIQRLDDFPAPVVDRATLEQLLCVRRREAIRLMHRFGGYQAGRTFLIGRPELLSQLKAIERGEVYQEELQRRQRLQTSLRPRKVIHVAPETLDPQFTDLPPGIRFTPGILQIEFENAEDLLSRLFELAQAIHNDFERFETTIAPFVPILSPEDGKACT